MHVVDKNTEPYTHSMTWAMDWFDGRATFQMDITENTLTVTWLDIGNHQVYK